MSSAGPEAAGSQLATTGSRGGVGAAALVRGAMPPPPPRPPKRKELVLEEDDWTANLEAIIERDFFPELPKLESKIAWLQAIRSGDPEQVRQAQLLIAQRRAAAAAGGAGGRPLTGAGAPLFTPGGTAARAVAGDTPFIPDLPPGVPLRGRPGTGRPMTGQTDAGGSYEEEEAAAQVGAAPPVSLDTFLAAHTSEDNASFQEILENVNKKRRLKAAAQLLPQPNPKLLLTDGRERTDGFGSTGQAPDTLVTWKYEPKNALFYDFANREPYPYSEAELAAQVQGAPKAINHNATRFPRELVPSSSATPSTSSMSGGGGGSTAGGKGPAAGGGGAERAAAAAGLAGTRGYDIMATPSFDPAAGGQTPLMTWGDIEGTPMRIEAEDLPPGPPLEGGPSFYIKESTAREQKSQQLSSRAAISLRHRRGGPRGGTGLTTGTLAAAAAARRQGSVAGLPTRGGSTARPPTGREPTGGRPLSEAARRLASSMHKGRVQTDDLGLRATYRGSAGGTTRRSSAAATPAASSGAWSGAPTPARATPAGGATPSVHATLEEEELRVQALLKARQAETERSKQLDAAREAARQAIQEVHPSKQQPRPQVGLPAGGSGGAGGGSGADLTAGLLNI